jgi:hypothetical protein
MVRYTYFLRMKKKIPSSYSMQPVPAESDEAPSQKKPGREPPKQYIYIYIYGTNKADKPVRADHIPGGFNTRLFLPVIQVRHGLVSPPHFPTCPPPDRGLCSRCRCDGIVPLGEGGDQQPFANICHLVSGEPWGKSASKVAFVCVTRLSTLHEATGRKAGEAWAHHMASHNRPPLRVFHEYSRYIMAEHISSLEICWPVAVSPFNSYLDPSHSIAPWAPLYFALYSLPFCFSALRKHRLPTSHSIQSTTSPYSKAVCKDAS